MVRISQASQAVNSSGEQLVEISNASIAITSSGTLTVDGSGVTQPVSAASLPLPSGAATSALQTSGNSSLSTLAGAVSGSEMQVDIVSGTVATTAPSVSGSNNNHLNGQSVTSAYASSGFDVSSASRFSIMGNTTEQSLAILVEVSPDNSNWYRINTELYPTYTDSVSPYDFYGAFDAACVAYVRLNFAKYTGTETVNATILTQ